MAKKSSKKLKMTLSQQKNGLRVILEKTRSPKLTPEIFQETVDELVVPFQFIKIECDGSSYESLRDIDSSALIPVDAHLIFPFPHGGGALIVGHSEVVSVDKETIGWLEEAAMLLGILQKSIAPVRRVESEDRQTELKELRERLEVAAEETSREIEAVRQSARREIEKVKEEAAAQIREMQQNFETKMREDTLWDELTLLPNSKLFPLMMSPMLAHARRSSDLTAVMYMEIGRIEEMMQAHGFEHPDRIIKQILDRMMKNLREGDIAVRGGENQILWCLGGLHSLEDTATVAEKMLLSLSRPLEVDGKTLNLAGSIGISLFPIDGPDPETLMVHAATALEVSRKSTGNSIRFYSKEMNERVRSYLMSRKELKEAIAKQEFALHYQPVVRFVSNEVESVEALIRWKKQGLTVYPINFLGLSEQIGIASQLDEWMIRTACMQRRQWEKEGLGTTRVSVNLSQNFFWENGVEKISQILQQTGTPANFLDLEIAERFLSRDAEKTIARLTEYSAMGVNLTIDDFGSSGGLLNLSTYPVNAIKLFPAYIRGIQADSPHAAVVSSALSLAHNLNIRVIAKAIETQAERVFLETLGCDGYQGNFFSPALPKSLLTEFLRKQQMKPAPVLPAQVEKTQPMDAEIPEIALVLPDPRIDMRKVVSVYPISCFYCQQKYDANQADWCMCITSDATVICPACQKCFCRATLDYRHGVWGSAPETFWDRKREHEDAHDSLPLNPILQETKRPLVLIVDDEPGVLKIAARLIRGLGYSVIVGQNGEEGFSLAKHYLPDLVISDALMPKLDGREMCNMLKGDPQTAKIKAIIMTSFTGAAKYKTTVLRDYQFDEQLQKPVEFDKLRTMLQRFLGS